MHAGPVPDLDPIAVSEPDPQRHAERYRGANAITHPAGSPDSHSGSLPDCGCHGHAGRNSGCYAPGATLGSGYSSTTVVPSPPSSRRPDRVSRTRGCSAKRSRMARRRAPVPAPWMMATESSPARSASSR